jgi:hypothetical protein
MRPYLVIAALVFGVMVVGVYAQESELEITRRPHSPEDSIRLINLDTKGTIDETNNASKFFVSPGLYLIEETNPSNEVVLREIEFVDKTSDKEREVGWWQGMGPDLVFRGPNTFSPMSGCAEIQELVLLEMRRYGIASVTNAPIYLERDQAFPCGPTSTAFFDQSGTKGFVLTVRKESAPPWATVIRHLDGTLPFLFLIRNKQFRLVDGISAKDDLYALADGKYLPFYKLMDPRLFELWSITATPANLSRNAFEEYLRHWPEIFPAGNAESNQLRNELTPIRDEIVEDFLHLSRFRLYVGERELPHLPQSALPLLEPVSHGIIEETEFGYQTSAVSGLLLTYQSRVEKDLDYPAFTGLQSYFRANQKQFDVPRGNYISVVAARKLIDGFVHVVDRIIASTDDISVTLKFNTSPPMETENSELRIKPSEGRVPSVYSQGGARNLYRGYYSFCVSKPGYDPVGGKLDLIDQPGTHLDCDLARAIQHRNALPGADDACFGGKLSKSICRQE